MPAAIQSRQRQGNTCADEVQSLQGRQPGQLLQPRVRHLGAARSSFCRDCSARPVPSAPRRSLSSVRSSVCKLLSPASSFSPASVTRIAEIQRLQRLSPVSSFSPATVTFVYLRVQGLQGRQSGQPLQPGVRHLQGTETTSVCRDFSPATSLQARARQLWCCRDPESGRGSLNHSTVSAVRRPVSQACRRGSAFAKISK